MNLKHQLTRPGHRKIGFLKTIIAIVVLFGCQNLSAQTKAEKEKIISKTNVENLQILKTQFAEKYTINKAKALKLAKENNWIIRKEFENGRIIELMGVTENGIPMYYTTYNIDAAHSISTNKVWNGGSLDLNLHGQNMTIGEWDGGAIHTTHQEFDGRVTQKDSPGSESDHATHVACTMLGEGVESDAQGMANQAELNAYDWTLDESEMAAEASAGLLVSNHSYGYTSGWAWNGTGWDWYGDTGVSSVEDFQFGFYGSESADYDDIANNAPYYLIIKAAGNDRGDGPGTTPATAEKDGGADGYDCISYRGISKNVLTVGAAKDVAIGYSGNPDDVEMTSFSGWGPCDDGRIKPDICGNGYGVYSANATADDGYESMNGTSMASPNVSGSLILLQQHYNNLYSDYIKAATLKALVIHTADESGPDNGPDYMFGWGLMNTATVAQVISQKDVSSYIIEDALSNSETYTFDVTSNGVDPLVVTVVWSDPAGTPVADALDPTDVMLVNDLDLNVSNSKATHYPWKLDISNPSNAATNVAENNVDNVEKVEVASPTAGTYTITIDHDGTLSADQSFSLIVSGITNIDNDVAIIDIDPQVSSCNYSSSTPIDISIGNLGKVNQTSSFSFEYEVRKNSDNAIVASGTENISSLNAGVSTDVIIYADMSETSETYTITASTTLSNDQNSSNDTREERFTSTIADLTNPGDSIYTSFEVGGLSEIGWSYEDVNDDGRTWIIYEDATKANSGDKFAMSVYHSTNTANDWMFSTCLNLETGHDYEVSFYYARTSGYTEKLELYYGTSQSAASMTNSIFDYGEITNDAYESTTKTFSVSSTGVYYIGWHAYSDADKNWLRIDDVTIKSLESATLPLVSTTSISSITVNSASSGGDVTDIGSTDVSERGIVFATSYNPTTSDNIVIDAGSGSGAYSSSLTGLNDNKTYYVRAYAINSSKGTSYGANITFTTLKDEPENHASGFVTGTASSSEIPVFWNDATADSLLPDGYLIKSSTTSYAAITVPGDGTAVSNDNDLSDGSGAINVDFDEESYNSWTGIAASTTYYLKIYPYTNSDTDIDYKIDGTIPQTEATTPTFSSLTSECFDGGSAPTGWSTEIVSGTPNLTFVTSSSHPTGFSPDNCSNFVRFDSWTCSAGNQARLYQTTSFSSSGYSSVTVNFAWAEDNEYSSSNDNVSVQWSTDGSSWTSADSYSRYNASGDAWHDKSCVLPSGASDQADLYVAFLFESGYGNDCHLDDVVITAASAQNGTWTAGGGSNNWDNASNWVGGIPTSSTEITISDGDTVIVNTTGAECAKLTINSGGTMLIEPDQDITIHGTFVNNGQITIQSNASGTGSLIDNIYTGSGNATVERYLATASRYYYVAPSVNNQTALMFGNTVELSGTGTDDRKLYHYDDIAAAWTRIQNQSTELEAFKGYAFKTPATSGTTWDFNGFLNSTEQIIELPNNNYSLIGNPYPSAVDWGNSSSTGWSTTGLSTSIWYRIGGAGTSSGGGGSFATYNRTGGTGQNGGQRYIPSMQSFWVKTTSTDVSITVNNDARTHSTQDLYKKRETNIFRLTVNNNGYIDEAVIGFYPNANNSFDDYDSEKMFTSSENYPQIYSQVDDYQLSIAGYSELIENLSVLLGFRTQLSGTFTFAAYNIKEFDDNIDVYIEDIIENKIINLRENPEYEFASDPVNITDRFILYFYFSPDLAADENLKDQLLIYSFEDRIIVKSNPLDTESPVLKVYDLLGRNVFSRELENKSIHAIRPDVSSGFYIVKFINGQETITTKVYIE